MITNYHAKYYANELSIRSASDGVDRLSQSLFDAKIDLNPHQIEAALFALKNPLTRGIIMADEVGLGKTIEAGLVLCQYWAERKRRLLIICPASLRPFEPSTAEWTLYERVSAFLEREESYALPKAQRHLTGLILRKLLASSTRAVLNTLENIRKRLEKLRTLTVGQQEELPLENLIEEDDLGSDYAEAARSRETDEEDDAIAIAMGSSLMWW